MNKTKKNSHYSSKDIFEEYVTLIGLDEAIKLLASRAKAGAKLERLKAKSTREQFAGSKPDGRLNGPNPALGSLVAKMGGKRKAKKTKRGF